MNRGSGDCASDVFGSVASWSEFLISGAEQAAMAGGYDVPDWAGGAAQTEPDMGGESDTGGTAEPDMGVDAATDMPTTDSSDDGCSTSSGARDWPGLLLLAAIFWRGRR